LAPQAKILGAFFNPISHNFATVGLSQRAPSPTFARGGSTRTQTALPVGPLQHMGPAGSEDAWCTSEAWCRVFGGDRSPKQLHRTACPPFKLASILTMRIDTHKQLPVGPLQHMGPAGSEDAWCTSEAWCVGATTTVVKPTTIDTMSTAAKSDMSSRVKSMRENTKERQDVTPLVVHNPVDDENAPPDRGEQFGPHRRGMPSAVRSRRGVEAARQSSTALVSVSSPVHARRRTQKFFFSGPSRVFTGPSFLSSRAF